MPRPAARLFFAAHAMLLHTSPHAAGVQLLPAVDSPSGGGGTVVLEPVPQRAQPTRRLVYSCAGPGLVTFSDRPCGPLPEVRELRVQEPPPAAAGAAQEPGKGSKHTAQASSPAVARENANDPDGAVAAHVTACQKLQATLDSLDSRMRTGYSAREAGRLWERWREAKVRLREANC
ncbi:MAG: hypothetical protein RL261_522 [Pseudomonadota bacterium]